MLVMGKLLIELMTMVEKSHKQKSNNPAFWHVSKAHVELKNDKDLIIFT